MRTTIPRCGHTGAIIGGVSLFYSDDEKTYMDGYSNLIRNIPPILTKGAGMKIMIVDPECTIPDPIDLPHPRNYEALVFRMCSWTTTSIYYLSERY